MDLRNRYIPPVPDSLPEIRLWLEKYVRIPTEGVNWADYNDFADVTDVVDLLTDINLIEVTA